VNWLVKKRLTRGTMMGSVRLAPRSPASLVEDLAPKIGAEDTTRVAVTETRLSTVTLVDLIQLRAPTIGEGILGQRMLVRTALGRTRPVTKELMRLKAVTWEDSGRWRGLSLSYLLRKEPRSTTVLLMGLKRAYSKCTTTVSAVSNSAYWGRLIA
jgi:hypothetical protein